MKKWFIFLMLKLGEITSVWILFWKLPLFIGYLRKANYIEEYPYLYLRFGYPLFDQWFEGISFMFLIMAGIFTLFIIGFLIFLLVELNLRWANKITERKKRR